MSLNPISPIIAKGLVHDGATLIDIREPHEFAARSIPGARNLPLSTLAVAKLDIQGAKVIFMCQSGMRTAANALALSRLAGPGAQVMQGGLNAWAGAGLPTESSGEPRKKLFGIF